MKIMNDTLSLFWVFEFTLIAVFVVLCFLIYSIRQNTHAINNIGNSSHADQTDNDEPFDSERADKLVDKGDAKELGLYCESFMKDNPHSVHANWYYALGKYNSGDYEMAREYFENVIRINPLWRDGAIVYLQEIAEKIGMPPSKSLH